MSNVYPKDDKSLYIIGQKQHWHVFPLLWLSFVLVSNQTHVFVILIQDVQHREAMGSLHMADRSSLISEVHQLRGQLEQLHQGQQF